MLVLKVAGVVDLTQIKGVKNILLSQIRFVTRDIFADIALLKVNPSEKLSAKPSVKDYKYIEKFGGIDNMRNLEGIYMGYIFFDCANIKPLFSFMNGLTYTDFKIDYIGIRR